MKIVRVQGRNVGRPRKKHVQLELPKLDKNGQRRGGKRTGAGRPRKGARVGAPHKRRPTLKPAHPVLVTLRVHADLGNLRKWRIYHALRAATFAVALRETIGSDRSPFRIVHISIQRTHVHLLVEAANKTALSRGMQGFQISAAKHMNRAVSIGKPERRRGTVFPDRFHQEIITNVAQARHSLSYVLNNWRKHREDRGEHQRPQKLDAMSTGMLFPGWKELEDTDILWRWPQDYEVMCVYRPRTWLLYAGWRKAGPISFRSVPSERWS